MNIKVEEGLWLRSLEIEDLAEYRALLNRPEIEDMLVGWNYPLNRTEQERWYQNQPMKGNTQRFSLVEDEQWIGFAGLWGIDWKDRYAEIGLALKPGNHGRGLGQKVILAVTRYGFDVLNLHRIETQILAYNEASNRAFLKCGYQMEGVQRNKIFKKGQYHDLNLLGLLRENYQSK